MYTLVIFGDIFYVIFELDIILGTIMLGVL